MATRTTLKDRLVTVLKNGGSGPAGNRVYVGRRNVLPAASSDLPVIYVYMVREDNEVGSLSMTGRTLLRNLTLAVDYWTKQATPENVEDAMDTACATIETSALGDGNLSGGAQDVVLTSCEYLYEGSEDQPHGCARTLFLVKYTSDEP